MKITLLYRQLPDQLSQWVQPKDQRHLQGFAEIVAAILQSGKACLNCSVFCLGWALLYLAQVVLEHGSTTVGFEQYRPVLERAQQVLSPGV